MKIKSYLLGILFIFFAQNQAMAQPQYEVAFSESLNADIPKDFFSGKYVILDFWQTWCAPCIASFEETNELMAKYDNDALVFANITNETHKIDRIKKIFKINPFDGYQLIDADNQTFTQFKVNVFPTVIILGKSGELLWRGFPGDLDEELILEKTGVSHSSESKEQEEKNYTLHIEPSNAPIEIGSYIALREKKYHVQFDSAPLHEIISTIKEVTINRVTSNDEKSNDFGIHIKGAFPSESYSYQKVYDAILEGVEKEFNFSAHEVVEEEDVWFIGIVDPQILADWKSDKTSTNSFSYSKKKVTFLGFTLEDVFSTLEDYADGYFEVDPNIPTEILKGKYDLSIPRDPEKLDAQLRKNYGLSVSKKRMEVAKIKLEFQDKIIQNFNPESRLASMEALFTEDFDNEAITGTWENIIFGDEVKINLSFDDNSKVIGTFEVIGVGKNPIEILERKGNYLSFSTTIMGDKVEISLWFTSKDVAKGFVNKEMFVTFDRVK